MPKILKKWGTSPNAESCAPQLRRSYIEITQKSPANAASSGSRGASLLHHSYMANKKKDTGRMVEEWG